MYCTTVLYHLSCHYASLSIHQLADWGTLYFTVRTSSSSRRGFPFLLHTLLLPCYNSPICWWIRHQSDSILWCTHIIHYQSASPDGLVIDEAGVCQCPAVPTEPSITIASSSWGHTWRHLPREMRNCGGLSRQVNVIAGRHPERWAECIYKSLSGKPYGLPLLSPVLI